LQAGQSTLTADYGGPRGPGLDGTYLVTELAGSDPAWRLFGGYGLTFGQFYVGAELEGESSDSEFKFTREVNRRRMRVTRGDGVGLTARLGYMTQAGSLLFTRLGVMRTDFNVDYLFQDASVSYSTTDEAFQAGIGAEVPLSKRLAWRMDYTWRNYPGIEIDYDLGLDKLDSEEGVFYAGLQAALGGDGYAESVQRVGDEKRFSGLYLGGHVGHGVISTDFEGRRGQPAQGGFVSTVVGSDGFTAGGTAGFGTLFNRFYLGLEAELEAGMSQFSFDRQVDVRTFTVDKRESGGLGVRLGYALADRALLYTGVGLLTTRFETRYLFRDVLEIVDKRVHGTRFVLGTEIPAVGNLSWRIEYSYTDYKPYSTVEETSDTFDINETLFRTGAIVRF
jgi:opacity protein-like surface antigen